jgi:hypothetical protein
MGMMGQGQVPMQMMAVPNVVQTSLPLQGNALQLQQQQQQLAQVRKRAGLWRLSATGLRVMRSARRVL